MKPAIKFDEFLVIESKLEIRIGRIKTVEFLPKNKRMLKLSVDFGTETRQVITNIGDKMDNPESILKYCDLPFITNLEPATISGHLSEAMIMMPMVDGQMGVDYIAGAKLL